MAGKIDEAELKAEYESSKTLQNEFHTVEAYLAYKRHEQSSLRSKNHQDELTNQQPGVNENEDELRQMYFNDQKLQDEFHNFGAFVAYCRRYAKTELRSQQTEANEAEIEGLKNQQKKAADETAAEYEENAKQYENAEPCQI